MNIFTRAWATGSILAIILFFNVDNLSAQINAGGLPIGPNHNNQPIEEEIIPAFDVAKARQEDQQNAGNRFAAPIEVDYSLDQNGSWIMLPNGDRLWRIQLYAQDAKGIFVYYDDFYLPNGSRLFMYDPDVKQVKGAYTSANNSESGKFLTGMIKGETAIIEYYEPASVRGQGIVDISKIYYAYDSDYEPEIPENTFKVYAGFGDGLNCHTNINCSEGDDWQEHKRGIVRILRVFDEGVGWCSGSMINNTAQDETPYVLSAYHCYDGFTPQLDVWRFDFNYESSNCSNPGSEPTYNSMLGCNLRAGWSDTDVLLLELLSNVPSAYNIRFNGWNRTLTHVPDTGTLIHHPQGDIKKISQDYDQAVIFNNSINWNNGVTTPPNHHYLLFMDLGTIENGSSGSNLFDEEGRIVGQLHGGNASCTTFQTYFGRFALSWDEGPTASERLMDWLDPQGTGQLTIDELEPVVPDMITLNGNVQARTGQSMGNVEIQINSTTESYTLYTDNDGNYSIQLPAGATYTVEPHRDTLPANGVTGFDILQMTRDILLIEEFDDPLDEVAADTNNNGSVSTFDIVKTRRVILNLDENFAPLESWRFSPANNTTNVDATMNFIGIKVGDPSGSANPN